MTDLDDSEDKLNILTAQKVLEDEEGEGGAGIDYRRMFKGYTLAILLPANNSSAKRRDNSICPNAEKRTLNLMERGSS